MRRIENDCACAFGKCRTQESIGDAKVRTVQLHSARSCAGHCNACGIGVIRRIKKNNFITGVAQTKKNCGDRFCAACRHGDFALGIRDKAAESFGVTADCTICFWQSKGACILAESTVNRSLCGIFYEVWAIEIWKTLPKIDGFVLDRQSTHRAEDGFSKWRESGTGVLDDLCHVAGSLFVIKCAVDIYANGLR